MFLGYCNVRCVHFAHLSSMNFSPTHNESDPTCTKVYYASRTHSQLTQVLPELGKLKIPGPVSVSSLDFDPSSSSFSMSTGQDVSDVQLGKRRVEENMREEQNNSTYYQSRALSLGSRRHLCINDELHARVRDIDEGCRELLAGEY